MPAKRLVVLFDKEEEDVDNSSKKKKNVIVDNNIQPLRDLALNFDIYIEPYLCEYLKDVQTNDNEGDNNNEEDNENTTAATTQQTFATAAIELQISAGIYDRKV
jgi:hypothetical protein